MHRTFDDSLKIELARRGLTQAPVAEVLGLSVTTFRSYLLGYRPAPEGFRKRFRDALDLVERADAAAEQARADRRH